MRRLCTGLTIFMLAISSAGNARGESGSGETNEAKVAGAGDASPKGAAAAPSGAETAAEIELLKQMLEQQNTQYEEQRTLNSELRNRLAALESQLTDLRAAGSASSPVSNADAALDPADPIGTARNKSNDAKNAPSPLFFRIGRANFTPGGFMDFTTVVRSKTVGSGIGTTLGTIPFDVPASYPAAGLSEVRMSEQNSRLSLKIDSQVASANVFGYVETDFLGNNATTLDVTSNSATLRLRLAFADVTKGKWEFLGGQGWSLMTPNRKGLSPMTNDVFYSLDNDTNYQLGVVWARQAQIRAVYHPNDSWAVGVSAENPQQYIGSALTLPTAFASTQADTNGAAWGANTNTPNVLPDIVVKAAYDTNLGEHSLHVDAAGLYRTFKINTFAAATKTAPEINANSTAVGAGVSLNTNFEVFKNFHFVENAFWSDGGGRYMEGLAPDFIVRPANAAGVYTVSPVHSGSGVLGFEWQAFKRTQFYGYYSALYASRNFVPVAPNTSCGASDFCGFGFPGSSNATNRSIQEPTLGIVRKAWDSPELGKLVALVQVSYVTRDPWSIAAGTPRNADLVMGYISLRYILP
jgi:hypothetical protein